MQESLATAIKDAAEKGLDNLVASLREQQRDEFTGAQGGTSAERMVYARNALGDTPEERDAALKAMPMSEKIKGMQNILGPTIEQLKQLGPEGELIAGVTQGGLAIAGAWAHAGEVMSKTAEQGVSSADKAQAALTAVSVTLSAISQVMQQASQQKIAAIDGEIAAEKRRDGKSKESLAKIKALEAKKESQKRKAFEQNKKMQMAMVVVNTAMAVSAAVAGAAQSAAGTGPMAFATLPAFTQIMVGMMVALGAAQLAIIAGTSYQGGGGGISSAGTGPSSISIGSRGTKSDMSKSRGARGELAYFRGDQGIGGAESFRGAFYGKKHRAAGGNTGYVVGEQGPELFMPDRPGTIIPADDTAAMAGGGANVTFNISAIDAAGVEDVLMEQQGNIIGMLRSAANSYGEEFMEDIDETVYSTPRAAGVGRWGA